MCPLALTTAGLSYISRAESLGRPIIGDPSTWSHFHLFKRIINRDTTDTAAHLRAADKSLFGYIPPDRVFFNCQKCFRLHRHHLAAMPITMLAFQESRAFNRNRWPDGLKCRTICIVSPDSNNDIRLHAFNGTIQILKSTDKIIFYKF